MTFVVSSVTLAWLVVLLASLYTREYTPLFYVTPLMGAVVGYVTGLKTIWRPRERVDDT